MSSGTDQSYLLHEQYKDSSNFAARVRLNARFKTNPTGWNHWVFERLQLAPRSRVLELGCGPALFWQSNLDQIPADWQITLSDFSPGMLQDAQKNLGERSRRFSFQVIDAQAIPFEDASLDAVIANHMLYHVPDRPKALAEIRRVLKPDGRLYATTVGESNMREVGELVRRVAGIPYRGASATGGFTLENGAAQLAACFDSVTLERFEDALRVTEVQPILDYLLSGSARRVLVGDTLQQVRAALEQELAEHGAIHISKDTGLFIAQNGAPIGSI